MRKYLYIFLGLALLLSLLIPSTVMAQESQYKLPDTLVGLPGFENGGWKFVIPGELDTYAPDCFQITWDNGIVSVINKLKDAGGASYYQLLLSEIPEGAKLPVLASFMFDGKLWQIPLRCPNGPVPPVPELPVVALMAVGLAGLGTFVFLKRKTWLPKVS